MRGTSRHVRKGKVREMADGAEETVLDRIKKLADELQFKDDAAKDGWINEQMKGTGWIKKTTWEPPTDGDKGTGTGKSGWFK
jgi:hypothetical protein